MAETNPSDEDKKSGRDQDQTDVPARSSSAFADKDLDATDEENEVYPLDGLTRVTGEGGWRTYHRARTRCTER
jgi:hypothetical protein